MGSGPSWQQLLPALVRGPPVLLPPAQAAEPHASHWPFAASEGGLEQSTAFLPSLSREKPIPGSGAPGEGTLLAWPPAAPLGPRVRAWGSRVRALGSRLRRGVRSPARLGLRLHSKFPTAVSPVTSVCQGCKSFASRIVPPFPCTQSTGGRRGGCQAAASATAPRGEPTACPLQEIWGDSTASPFCLCRESKGFLGSVPGQEAAVTLQVDAQAEFDHLAL